MDWIFGKKKTLKEVLREHQRALNKTIREIERERQNMERQEKSLTMEIKKMAQQGQMGAVKILAKDLVRTRAHIQKFYKLRAELQAVKLKIQTLRSQAEMADAMRGVTRVMRGMNARMNLPQMQRIMMEFEKQNEIMDMKEEIMSDTMDDTFGGEGEEEEMEEVVQKVLDEIGINLASQMADTPSQMAAPPQAAQNNDSELLSRLDNLKRD